MGRAFDPRARILQRIAREDGHWIWTGALNRDGYGRFWLWGRCEFAHRATFKLAFGEIPEGLEVDHLCRQPACVRPTHLRLATHAENMRNTKRAERPACIHGHPFDEANTYMHSGRRQCRTCNRAAVARYAARRAAAKESA